MSSKDLPGIPRPSDHADRRTAEERMLQFWPQTSFEQALLSSEDEYTVWWVLRAEGHLSKIMKINLHILQAYPHRISHSLRKACHYSFLKTPRFQARCEATVRREAEAQLGCFHLFPLCLNHSLEKKNKAELARIRMLEREQIAPHPAPENKNRSHLKTLDMLDRFAVNMKGFQRCRSSIWDFGLRGLRGINQKQGGASRGGHLSVTACALDARWCCLPCMPMETWDRPCWRWRQSLLSERRGCANELTSELCCSLEAIYSWIMLDHVGLVWYVPAHVLFNLSNADCGCSFGVRHLWHSKSCLTEAVELLRAEGNAWQQTVFARRPFELWLPPRIGPNEIEGARAGKESSRFPSYLQPGYRY